MRTFIIAILLVVVVLFGLFYYTHSLTDASESMLQKTEALRLATIGTDWENTKTAARTLKEDWQESSKRLATILEHEELDEIMLAAARAVAFAENEERPELLAEVYGLRELFEHISAKEALTIHNIF